MWLEGEYFKQFTTCYPEIKIESSLTERGYELLVFRYIIQRLYSLTV